MTLRDELLALKNKDDLIIVAEVHEWARKNPQSALYARLEWDNEKAGYEYRLQQIRTLIAVEIVSYEGNREAYSLTVDRSRPKGGYRELRDILPNKSLRENLLEDALNELERVKQKYHMLTEYARIWEEIDNAKQKRRKTRPKQKQSRQDEPSKV